MVSSPPGYGMLLPFLHRVRRNPLLSLLPSLCLDPVHSVHIVLVCLNLHKYMHDSE